MTRRELGTAALPVLAFLVPFAAYASNALAEPQFGTLLPVPTVAVGLLAGALAVGHDRGLAVAVTAAFCARLAPYADATLVDGWRTTLAGRVAAFGRPGVLLSLFVLSFVVGVAGYAAGGLALWAVRRVRAGDGGFGA